MAGALKRVQDLFRRGEVITLRPEAGEPVRLWVQKPNALQHDEALKDARQARALRMIEWDRSAEEQAQVEVWMSDMTDEDLAKDLLNRESLSLHDKAEDELRADKKWAERLEAIDRAEIATPAPGGTTSPARAQVLADLIAEWQKAVTRATERLLRERLAELKKEPRANLERDFRKAWRENLGANAFWEARRQTEIWYALHECEVDLDESGSPIASSVVVGDLLCPTRDDVNTLPDEVVAETVRVLGNLQMTLREAGNSVAPSASSGSSGQQSAAEDSTPSIPTATS